MSEKAEIFVSECLRHVSERDSGAGVWEVSV
jgi:hypothetical protein